MGGAQVAVWMHACRSGRTCGVIGAKVRETAGQGDDGIRLNAHDGRRAMAPARPRNSARRAHDRAGQRSGGTSLELGV